MQKRSKIFIISIYVLLFLAVAFCCGLGVFVSQTSAKADVSWNVRVTKYASETYYDLNSGDKVTDSNELYFLISDYQLNDVFQYYFSSELLTEEKLQLVQGGSWSNIVTTNTITLNDKTYIYHSETVESNFDKYIYFRRQYTVYEGETQTTMNEYYTYSWHIIVNTNLSAEDLGFNEIKATYLVNAVTQNYTGNWTNSAITFDVKTKWMYENNISYNPSDELLYYSVDNKASNDQTKQWRPMSSNKVTVRENLNNVNVWFRVTDISGQTKVAQAFASPVNMDIIKPSFVVNATTINNSGSVAEYFKGTWACNDVVFTLEDTSNCISPIEYLVSLNGTTFEQMDTNSYTISSSKESVVFRAVNAAGEYYSGADTTYVVKIDKVTPVVKLSARTDDPELTNDSNFSKELTIAQTPEGLNAGYANGRARFIIENKYSSGDYVESLSELKFYYAENTGSGNFNYIQLGSVRTESGGKTYYYAIMEKTVSGILENKIYRFKIVSGAGKSSVEVDLSIVLVNTYFELAIDFEDAVYSTNSEGWVANEGIEVFASMPTDTKLVGGQYTLPKTQYTFWYSPTNISGVIYSAQANYVGPISEGFSLYSFNLSASAESTFNIYATNAAGKKSYNNYTTPPIKIDTVQPTYELTATIAPRDENYSGPIQYITSEAWVNGSVIITLIVKVGISQVYVKELEYAIDGNGNPLYDDFGKLRWIEPTQRAQLDSSVTTEDGVKYNYYKFEKSVPDTSKIFSEEYRFRIYTGSGVRATDIDGNDPSFIVNIDLSSQEDIVLESLNIGDQVISMENTLSVNYGPVCEDLSIELIPNAQLIGHFVYYIWDEELNDFIKANGDFIFFSIADIVAKSGPQGTLQLKFYIESLAKDYKGDVLSSNPEKTLEGAYTLNISYDVLNLAINFELITVMDSAQWNIAETIDVNIILVKDSDGTVYIPEPGYHYYYMLIKYKANINLGEEIANGTWLECQRTSGESDPYQFSIDLAGKSFYGYLALSVTNVAGYRSSIGDISGNIIKVDNTILNVTDPDADPDEGEPEFNNIIRLNEESSRDGLNYYSTHPITLSQTSDFELNRSSISYYYIVSEPNEEEGDFVVTADSHWSLLDGNMTFEALSESGNFIPTRYFIVFYAVNEVNNESGGYLDGNYVVFSFFIDPTPISGTLSYGEGIYFDQSLNMYAFMWEDIATVNLSIESSNTELQYYFMRDDLKVWDLYVDPTIGIPQYYQAGTLNSQQLIFSAEYFPDGVKTSFTFKAVNRAGAEYIYNQKIYIAIDTSEPDFEIITTVNSLTYNGGSTTDLSDTTGAWSSVPVMVNINILQNCVSGIRFTYKLQYRVNMQETTTVERELPSKTSFPTDRLDGFDVNKDAILIITATRKSDANKPEADKKTATKMVRLRVDQVKPVFSLTGHASNDESTASKTIVSGEWTNRNTVSISKSVSEQNTNVSGVAYTYTYKDLDSTSVITNAWSGDGTLSFSKICTITVTARSGSGLTHTEVFQVNIDTVPPVIKFMSNISVIEGGNHFIDLKVYVEEENIEICEYITIKEDSRGFALDPNGYVLSTSSVDNSTRIDKQTGLEYRGYVRIYVKDYAGNIDTFTLYVLPFDLDVNNITLSDVDLRKVDKYEEDLDEAEVYMESNRVVYFRNLISRLRDRVATLRNEITTYRAYLEVLAQKSSFELKSDYEEMFSYLETYNNYEIYGQKWIQDAITGDASSKYFGYFKNLGVEFGKLKKEMEKVESVEKSTMILPAINMVEASDYNDILRVYDDYNDLTSDQKSCFATNLFNKLTALKKACEILLLTDEETGITLNGDFAPGAKIDVNNYSDTTEIYSNAQKAILSSVSSDGARAVVSVNRISLVGASSQTSTGEVSVVLPIPEEYRNYIKFSVYKVSNDGSVTEINKVIIAGDGKSVSFTSDELATFVLATKANIEGNVPNEGVFGTLLGLELDVTMIRNLAIIGAAIFVIVIVVVVIAGIRNKKFLNSYNRAYRSSIYRRGVQRIPKGNTLPRVNPLNNKERVKTQTKPY